MTTFCRLGWVGPTRFRNRNHVRVERRYETRSTFVCTTLHPDFIANMKQTPQKVRGDDKGIGNVDIVDVLRAFYGGDHSGVVVVDLRNASSNACKGTGACKHTVTELQGR